MAIGLHENEFNMSGLAKPVYIVNMKTKLLTLLKQSISLILLSGFITTSTSLFANENVHLSLEEKATLDQGGIILREIDTPGGKTIEALTLAKVPKQTFVDVILNYEHYPNFMPNVSEVEIVHQNRVESVLNFSLSLPLGITKKYRIGISETKLSKQLSKVAWHSLEWPELELTETIKETTGHWLIQEQSDSSSLVLYHVFTDPGPIPWGLGWIVDLLTKNSIPDLLDQTRIQAELQTPSIPQTPPVSPQRVLFVVTSHDQLGTTGEQTGYYFSEVTHPYFQIIDAGFEVDIASPQGGRAPMDKRSLKLKDPKNLRFYENPTHMSKLEQTLILGTIISSDYSAILFVGGHGGMWDFPGNKTIGALTANIYEDGGIAAAVCHGPSALVDIKLSDNSYLVAGKTVTAFTNAEEAVKNLTEEMPFLLESKLIERGALFTKAGVWQEKVVVSERLITGQNPASAEAVGQAIVQLLQAR